MRGLLQLGEHDQSQCEMSYVCYCAVRSTDRIVEEGARGEIENTTKISQVCKILYTCETGASKFSGDRCKRQNPEFDTIVLRMGCSVKVLRNQAILDNGAPLKLALSQDGPILSRKVKKGPGDVGQDRKEEKLGWEGATGSREELIGRGQKRRMAGP